MTSAAFIEDLREKGVELMVEGDQLRCIGPRGWQAPGLLADLRAHKPDLVRHLRLIDFMEETDSTVLIRSRLLGGREVWIALSDEAAVRILSEEQHRAEPRPVLRQADVQRLVGKSPEMIAAVLRVAAAFPGARVVH